MANPEHLAKLKQGVDAWNRWRKQNPHVHPWLANADLSGFRLSQVNLSLAGLRGAKLREAILDRGDFRKADFEGVDASECSAVRADFSEANLRQVRFEKANLGLAVFTSAQFRKARLVGANFRFATLSGTKLSRCSVEDTDFTNAQLYEVSFIDLDMSSARGLEMCKHHGPSAIDHRTLRRSSGLPRDFLRGCGLSDWEIAGAEMSPPNLSAREVTDTNQFYSCFISHSTKDQEFADRLNADLQNRGVRCWFAPHDMAGGKKIHEQIDSAIHMHDRLLLILSPASLDSKWVRTEIVEASKREAQENRRMLFPVRLVDFETLKQWKCFNADLGMDLAEEIREYYVPDFSNWKDHDCYQKEFERLLKALRTEQRAINVTPK